MIVELGHFALRAGAVVVAPRRRSCRRGARASATRASWQCRRAGRARPARACCRLPCLALTHAYVVSDFSVANVWANSHSTKPLIYRISGVWGNHEGSMLLWVLILAAVRCRGRRLRHATCRRRCAPTCSPCKARSRCAFLLFIALTSNPFLRLDPVPARRPRPQPDPAGPRTRLPPALPLRRLCRLLDGVLVRRRRPCIEGRTDAAWARWVRPWTLAAWMCLTLGIAMGSWWAYYELGWGGWWFWDPVENASFMPWLAGTALLHSAARHGEARGAQGVDHPARDPDLLAVADGHVPGALGRAHLGACLCRRSAARRRSFSPSWLLFIGGALTLFAARAPALRQGGLFAPLSREGSLVLNNILLTTATATVLVGTLYPLALESIDGARISVGAALLQHDVRAAHGAAAAGAAVRAVAGVEARRCRSPRCERLLLARRPCARRRCRRARAGRARPVARALRHRLSALWVIAGTCRDLAFRVKLGRATAARGRAPARESAARGLGRRRWRTPASASW